MPQISYRRNGENRKYVHRRLKAEDTLSADTIQDPGDSGEEEVFYNGE